MFAALGLEFGGFCSWLFDFHSVAECSGERWRHQGFLRKSIIKCGNTVLEDSFLESKV